MYIKMVCCTQYQTYYNFFLFFYLQNPIAHVWSDRTLIKRKFCNVCRKKIEDTLGLCCEGMYLFFPNITNISSVSIQKMRILKFVQIKKKYIYIFKFVTIMSMTRAKSLPYLVVWKKPHMTPPKRYVMPETPPLIISR